MFKINRIHICIALLILAVVLFMPTDAYAAFENLKTSGKEIFNGLKKIIYPASAIGIICICIGGFFGNINWKWLTAIFVGLIVIAMCGAFIYMFAGDDGGIESKSILGGD